MLTIEKSLESKLALMKIKAEVKKIASATREERKLFAKTIGYARKVAVDTPNDATNIRWAAMHQIHDVTVAARPDRRFVNLAYGFLKGRTYRQVESTGTIPESLTLDTFAARVAKIVAVYDRKYIGPGVNAIRSWVERGDVTRTQLEDAAQDRKAA